MRITKTVNVVAYYNVCGDQIAITKFLRKEAKLKASAPIYFDDADLVYIDKTILRNALCNNKFIMQDLIDAVVKATA